ncbi:MAG: hypothetical protein EOP14_00550 [Pseudomonas sp.]|nr:MAG: hypothetical protein EOP14_00550 [Pseudomonas sp.]
MSIFNKGANWEATRTSDLVKSRNLAWMFAGLMGLCLVTAVIALAMLTPLRRTVPYLVKMDTQTGNIEVLRTFDNQEIGTDELNDKYWAQRYVLAREQYNWWLVSTDYDTVAAMTDPTIFKEYGDQFVGEKGLDKVFGDFTERRIRILSLTPSLSNPQQMIVRFERTTVSKGNVVEAPTVFVVNMTFRYIPNKNASEAEGIRNPRGYQVYSYRRDVEISGSVKPGTQAAGQGGGA